MWMWVWKWSTPLWLFSLGHTTILSWVLKKEAFKCQKWHLTFMLFLDMSIGDIVGHLICLFMLFFFLSGLIEQNIVFFYFCQICELAKLIMYKVFSHNAQEISWLQQDRYMLYILNVETQNIPSLKGAQWRSSIYQLPGWLVVLILLYGSFFPSSSKPSSSSLPTFPAKIRQNACVTLRLKPGFWTSWVALTEFDSTAVLSLHLTTEITPGWNNRRAGVDVVEPDIHLAGERDDLMRGKHAFVGSH